MDSKITHQEKKIKFFGSHSRLTNSESLGVNVEQKSVILIHYPRDSALLSLVHAPVNCEPLISNH